MESAALAMLFSSMGVMFGWQPMPDGASNEDGPKLEYIVQIEPELAATLKAGQSIPITSDIPDNIGPIGRIRIVVGRDELPRQKLVTRFKPWPAKTSREGIVETQVTVSPVQSASTDRYSNLASGSNPILPPSGSVGNGGGTAAANRFGQAARQGAQQVKNLAADLKQQILPPPEQLFGQGGAGSRSVQNAINHTAQGVQQVAERTEQGLRQAAGNLGQGAREAADKFGRSLLSQRTSPNDGHDPSGHGHAGHAHGQTSSLSTSPKTILPPPNSSQTGLVGKGRRIDQPPTRRQQPQLGAPPANFAGSSPARTNPSSRPGVFDAPWPSTTSTSPPATRVGNSPSRRYNNQAGQPPAAAAQWPSESNDRDTFDLANRSPNNRSPQINNEYRQPDRNMASGGFEGPKFPSERTQTVSQQNADASWPTDRPSRAEIREEMLDSPAGSGSQDANSNSDYQLLTNGQQSYENRSGDSNRNQYRSDLADFSPDSNESTTLFPLLLSWVLLSGSGVGNLYLFMSYLDVRNKYHGLVHSSPGRRGRYDD